MTGVALPVTGALDLVRPSLAPLLQPPGLSCPALTQRAGQLVTHARPALFGRLLVLLIADGVGVDGVVLLTTAVSLTPTHGF